MDLGGTHANLECADAHADVSGTGSVASVRDELRLTDYVEHASEQIKGWDVPQIILVAYSVGGAICLDVASELPERVVGFIGLSAAIPTQEQSFLSCYPRRQQLVQRIIMRFAGTKPPDKVIRQSLCNGLSDAQSDRLVESFTPESRRLFTDTVEADIPEVPTFYLKTTADNEFPPSLQDRMIENLQTRDVIEIDAGHMAMLSRPREVATGLRKFDAGPER